MSVSSIIFRNFGIIAMLGGYVLLLSNPYLIDSPHARAIISEFIIFILPGYLLYKLAFNKLTHDIYEKMTLSFLFSSFVFIVTGSCAYFFRAPLSLYMNLLLALFTACTLFLLYRDITAKNNPAEKPISANNIFDFCLLIITGILVYLFTYKGAIVEYDGIDHIANVVKIADSGIIRPENPFFRESGLQIAYLYSPYYLILAVIKHLSSTSIFVTWHHLPKVLLFFLPICYYSLAKAVFNDKKIAYFAFIFIVGLIFADYYWHSISLPYPRKFCREIFIPIFYIALIKYFQSFNRDDLPLLVIATVVIIMFHPFGTLFVFFHCLLYSLFFLVFKGGVRNLNKLLLPYIAIILANTPYFLGIILNSNPSKIVNRIHELPYYHVSKLSQGIFKIMTWQFFSVDHLVCYLVVLCLILTQSNFAVSLIMLTAVMIVPVFLMFPPTAMIFSKIFSANLMSRLHDNNIRPFFFLCFLIFLSYYGIKYINRITQKEKSNLNKGIFWVGTGLLIALNAYFIHSIFWIRQQEIHFDVLVNMELNEKLRPVLIALVIISFSLFWYINRKKSFLSSKSPALVFKDLGNSHFLSIIFIPLFINVAYLLPQSISKMPTEQQMSIPLGQGYTLTEDHIPEHLQYISDNEKPHSVSVLVNNYRESHMVSLFIPQYIFNPPDKGLGCHRMSNEEWSERREITDKIYSVDFPLDKTMNLIYENRINYLIDRSPDKLKKFAENKNIFELVFQNKDLYLYKIMAPSR